MSDKKHKRLAISLDTKIQVLDRLATGQGSTSVGKQFGLNEATVRTIKKNEPAIRKSAVSVTKLSAKASSYTRDIIKLKMEKALMLWLEDCSQKKIPINGLSIKQKALAIYKQIKEKESTTSEQSKKNYYFPASNGWLMGFLRRNSLHNVKMKGEIAFPDEAVAKEFTAQFAKIIADGGYTSDQVWNADKTSVYWKKMPSRTFLAKSQRIVEGFRAAKDRVTILLCSNASGDRVLKPLVVNQSLRPRAMKYLDLNKLPVYWMANKRAWVTTEIFTEWFHECFVPEVRSYMEEKNQEFKALLVLDTAAGYPMLEHPNVQVCFLPPNTTSLIQPQDKGIITTFKRNYVKKSFEFIVNQMDGNKELGVIDAWKMLSIMDCVNHIKLALSELKESTLNTCWKAIWPECVTHEEPVPRHSNEYADIVTLAHEVGGEGFDDLSFADIEEMIVDKPLEDEEIIEVACAPADLQEENDSDDDDKTPLTAGLIKEGFQLANALENHFLTHDHLSERAAQFKQELTSCMARYRELYNELSKPPPQPFLTIFIKEPKSVASPETSANFVEDSMEKFLQVDCKVEDPISNDDSDCLIAPKQLRMSESDSE